MILGILIWFLAHVILLVMFVSRKRSLVAILNMMTNIVVSTEVSGKLSVPSVREIHDWDLGWMWAREVVGGGWLVSFSFTLSLFLTLSLTFSFSTSFLVSPKFF